MIQTVKHYITLAEYLAREAEATYKSEYYAGQMYAMAGGTINHNRIAGNIFSALSNAFDNGQCEVFTSDLRLLVKQNRLYTYPDLMAVCGEIEFSEGRTDTITNPTAIFEVLSKSTSGYDRKEKLELYSDLPTLKEYLLIDQCKVYVEYFQRIDTQKWILQFFKNEADVIKLGGLAAELPLTQVYRRVNFKLEDV